MSLHLLILLRPFYSKHAISLLFLRLTEEIDNIDKPDKPDPDHPDDPDSFVTDPTEREEREEDFFEGGGEEETVKSLVLRPVTSSY